ncbi:MAG: PAS domain S-box protein [Desulfobulbales bacterium]|nr:PAS domain S-box protein [Desulfobulbales bacterium]
MHITNSIKANAEGVKHLFPTLIEFESSHISDRIDLLKENKHLQQAWLARDIKNLLGLSAPVFSGMKSTNNITHFYFIDPDRNCFLRVHNPGRSGDRINRETMKEAARTGKISSGIELGPLGTFTLRVVHPWFIDNVLAGYIELGKEIHHIAPMVKRSLNVDLIFTINKSLLHRPDWEKGMRMLGRNADWELLPDVVIIDATNDDIFRQAGIKLALPDDNRTENVIRFSVSNRKLRGMHVPLVDKAAKKIGDILVVSDVTKLEYSLGMINLAILTLFLFIGGVLMAFIYFFLLKTEDTIKFMQNKLVAEIDERKKVEKELVLHRDNLENLVQKRTRELYSTVGSLKGEVEERMQAENALRLSEARFRSVFEVSALGITISDLAGHIYACNPAYQKMLGYTEKELKDKNFSSITHPDDVHKNLGLFQELLAGKRHSFTAEKRYLKKDGQEFWGRLTVSLVRDESDEPLFVIGLIEDIGEQKLLELERIKASKLESIGLLAGGIAHDFNNLFTAIMGNIALAKTYSDPEGNAFFRLKQAEKALLRSKSLTQQLLTFSKGGDPVKKSVKIDVIIRESASFALQGSNVKCAFDIAPDLWKSFVDIGQFSQVIQNLVINADHAMTEGGVINITAENLTVTHEQKNLPIKQGRYVKISFQDNGRGIPAKDLPRIFDPYFTTKKDGSGLGLSIVHSIVTNHGGHIEVHSQPEDGTTFVIYFPASLEDDLITEAEIPQISKGSGKILVMDDEEMIRDFAKEMLENLGYDVVLAKDGEEAVTLFQAAKVNGRPFAAVLMDITVPGGMGGKEAMEKLLAIDPAVKGIVSSGYAQDPIMSQYKDYGFTGVVPKPYNLEEMSRELQRVLAG